MKSRNVHIIAGICLSTIILFSGCSFKNSSSTTNANTTSNTSQSTKAKPIDVKALTALIQKIQSEKGVSGVNTSKSVDMLTVDITFKDDADNKNAKQLAEKYSREIKEIYHSQKININILQKGKKISELTLD